MAKTKNPVNVTAKIETLQATEIQNSINLNTTQNDLITMIIEDKVEKAENVIKVLLDKIQGLQNQRKAIQEKILAQGHNEVKWSSEYIKFMQMCKDNGFVPTLQVTQKGTVCDNYIESRVYNISNLQSAEESKVPLNYFKTRTSPSSESFYVISNVGISMTFINDIYSFKYYKEVKITDYNEQRKLMKEVILALGEAKQELYDAQLHYLNVKYNTNRIKAQITKSILGQSKDGVALLALLENATISNLLP